MSESIHDIILGLETVGGLFFLEKCVFKPKKTNFLSFILAIFVLFVLLLLWWWVSEQTLKHLKYDQTLLSRPKTHTGIDCARSYGDPSTRSDVIRIFRLFANFGGQESP